MIWCDWYGIKRMVNGLFYRDSTLKYLEWPLIWPNLSIQLRNLLKIASHILTYPNHSTFFRHFLCQKSVRFQVFQSRKGKLYFLWQKSVQISNISEKNRWNYLFLFFVTKKCADFKYMKTESIKSSFSDSLWHFQWLFSPPPSVICRCSLLSHFFYFLWQKTVQISSISE